ncbi:MAG: sugar phosphate nucleotidyltransferase [Actinomycetota bacterium]
MSATGILLAAGLGERLRPLTATIPKPALPLLDVPLGAWGLCNLLDATDEVVVNTSHFSETAIGALAGYGDFETLDEGPEPWGTGGTLAALRDHIGETAVVCNGDALTDVAARHLVAEHRRMGAEATVAVHPVDSGADLTIAGERATSFVDRRKDPRAPGARYLGLAAFQARALELLPDTRPAGIAESLLRPLVERGDVAVVFSYGYALDVGTVGSYVEASLDLLAGRGPLSPRPHPGEFIEVEGGRAYLGPDASCDEESLRAGAMVLAGALLHEGARVDNAIVWPGEEVPAGERVRGGVWARGRLVPAANRT